LLDAAKTQTAFMRSRQDLQSDITDARLHQSASPSFSGGKLWAQQQRMPAAFAAWIPFTASSITTHSAAPTPSFRAAAEDVGCRLLPFDVFGETTVFQAAGGRPIWRRFA
jgi:hypothetical protein